MNFVVCRKGWGESELASPRGRTPEYAVNVQEAEDVVKAVEFARRYKVGQLALVDAPLRQQQLTACGTGS